ncbi:MAG: ATP-binding protein [Ignavibacteriaceae bacterium]
MKTIKGKISFGLISLFAVILLLSILGILFINQLAQKSRGTIVENYSSVDYMMNMFHEFDDIYDYNLQILNGMSTKNHSSKKDYETRKNAFENNLQLETKNITEKNEANLVNTLNSSYRNYLNRFDQLRNAKVSPDDLSIFKQDYLSVRNSILSIYSLNMNAIKDKTNNMQSTAYNIIIYMFIVAGISIVATLFFIFSFPAKIVEPIKELTNKIKSISERKYDQKLDINTKDELGELSNAFNIMAERLKSYEAKQIDQLLFEQKRLDAVVHSFEDGILFIDESRKAVLINPTVLQLAGLEEKDILNQNVLEIASKNNLIKQICNALQTKSINGNSDIKPVKIITNGKESFFNIETEEIITFSEAEKKETFIGNLVLLRNITKYQERDKAKTNLLATVSHELKTPLSSINLSLRLLDDKRLGELNNEQKEVVITLKHQSLRLSKVINELLNYSQIETGNIKLSFSQIKPDIVLDIGITALMMQISEKSIALKTSIEEGLPEIRIDLEKVVFVFINILNNAIRYSKKGGEIKIQVRALNAQVEFSIKDNGAGILKEDQDKLFQRFTQLGGNSIHGWGLGLAISKEFIEAQNGKIWVESEIARGSKFSFSFPIT